MSTERTKLFGTLTAPENKPAGGPYDHIPYATPSASFTRSFMGMDPAPTPHFSDRPNIPPATPSESFTRSFMGMDPAPKPNFPPMSEEQEREKLTGPRWDGIFP